VKKIDMADVKKKLIRRLQLNQRRADENKQFIDSIGGISATTYHGGWNVGYYEGKVAAIESILDMLFEGWDDEHSSKK
jgi:hypothetical protein